MYVLVRRITSAFIVSVRDHDGVAGKHDFATLWMTRSPRYTSPCSRPHKNGMGGGGNRNFELDCAKVYEEEKNSDKLSAASRPVADEKTLARDPLRRSLVFFSSVFCFVLFFITRKWEFMPPYTRQNAACTRRKTL